MIDFLSTAVLAVLYLALLAFLVLLLVIVLGSTVALIVEGVKAWRAKGDAGEHSDESKTEKVSKA